MAIPHTSIIDKVYFTVDNLLAWGNHMYSMPSKTSETKLTFVYSTNKKVTTTRWQICSKINVKKYIYLERVTFFTRLKYFKTKFQATAKPKMITANKNFHDCFHEGPGMLLIQNLHSWCCHSWKIITTPLWEFFQYFLHNFYQI